MYQCQCFERLKCCVIVTLLLLSACITTVTAAEEQQSLPASTTDSQSCSLADHQPATACSTKQQNPTEETSPGSTPAAASADAARHLQEQIRTQQQILSVLNNITAGTFTADAAIALLQEAAELRESLLHGAAARRWAQLKARSAKARTSTTQTADVQQQQEGTPSQGILIVAGGRHQFLNTYILLQLLRHPTINCTLPAELVYYGTHEFDPATARLMTAHAENTATHLKLIDGAAAAAAAAAAAEVELEPHKPFALLHLTGFKTKVHALAFVTSFDQVRPGTAIPSSIYSRCSQRVQCSSRQPCNCCQTLLGADVIITADSDNHASSCESASPVLLTVPALRPVALQVLLLDSDNTPLADPTYLFNSAAFAASGNLQWLDFWTNQWMQPVLYDLLGLDVPWEVNPGFRASEAGQLLLDRVRHYDVLEWLWLLNTHSSSGMPGVRETGVVGKCVWGDKDTYPIAFQLAAKGSDVSNIPHHPLQALSRPGGSGLFVHAGMLQRGLDGELLFLHRTAAGKLWPHCAWHNREGCKVWGATTPVNQDQLKASVRDVTAMQFELGNVDLVWQETHCGPEFGAVDDLAGDGDDVDAPVHDRSKQDRQNGTIVACELDKSAGLLPIPVVAVQRLPEQVQEMLRVTHITFLESMQQPTATGEHMAGDQQYDDEESDPYY
jgi:hypothetical protein